MFESLKAKKLEKRITKLEDRLADAEYKLRKMDHYSKPSKRRKQERVVRRIEADISLTQAHLEILNDI